MSSTPQKKYTFFTKLPSHRLNSCRYEHVPKRITRRITGKTDKTDKIDREMASWSFMGLAYFTGTTGAGEMPNTDPFAIFDINPFKD